MTQNIRFNRVQALRLFAAALVVIGHVLICYSQKRELDQQLVTIVNWFSGWAVSLFFCISGFVITQSAQGRTAKHFLAVRLLRIYPGFWLAVVTQVGLELLLFGGVPAELYSAHSLSLLPLGSAPYPLMIEWSLIYEVVFYALFAGLWLRQRNSTVIAGIAVWLVLILTVNLIGTPYYERFPTFPSVLISSRNLPFIAGCIAYYTFTGTFIKRYSFCFVPLAIAFGLITVCATSSLSILSLHAVTSMLILLATVNADIQKPISGDAILIRLGDASYGLYLAHVTIINVCLARGPFEQSLLGIPALFAIAIGFGLAFGTVEQGMYRRLKSSLFRATSEPGVAATAGVAATESSTHSP